MLERKYSARFDKFLRSEGTPLAKALKVISPKTGAEYRTSTTKRISEWVVILPLSPVIAVAIGALAAAAKAEDGGAAFYRQNRVGSDGEMFELIKIRCMRDGADQEPWSDIHARNQVLAEAEDPRNTKIGRVMRSVEAEELPQLGQVLTGTLSLVDVRAIAPYARDYMLEEMGDIRFEAWDRSRVEGKPGLLSLNSAVNKQRKNDLTRDRLDRLYADKASLGLDMYIMYRTAMRMGGKALKSARDFMSRSSEPQTAMHAPEISRISDGSLAHHQVFPTPITESLSGFAFVFVEEPTLIDPPVDHQ